ncbi:MAG: hypothetical protein U1E76_09985 [Planctomycetota bacterium]
MPGSCDRALETLRRLRAIRARGLRVCVGFTLSSANADALPATLAFLRAELPALARGDLHLNVAHHSVHYYRNTPPRDLPLAARAALDAVAVARDAFGLVEWLFRRQLRHYLAAGRTTIACRAIAASIFVGADLTVHPCSTWDHPLGNLRTTDLALSPLLASARASRALATIASRACPGCCTACDTLPSVLAQLPRALIAAGGRAHHRRLWEPAS